MGYLCLEYLTTICTDLDANVSFILWHQWIWLHDVLTSFGMEDIPRNPIATISCWLLLPQLLVLKEFCIIFCFVQGSQCLDETKIMQVSRFCLWFSTTGQLSRSLDSQRKIWHTTLCGKPCKCTVWCLSICQPMSTSDSHLQEAFLVLIPIQMYFASNFVTPLWHLHLSCCIRLFFPECP